MLTAIDLEKSYHELIKMVCDRQSEICMIYRCKNCPGIEPTEQSLHHYMRQKYVQDTEDNEVSNNFDEIETDFKKWITTDRTDLKSMKLSSNSLSYFLKRQIKSPPTHLLQGHNEMLGYH